MYHAKNSGKNDVVVFRAKDHTASLERLRLENALRRALEHQEFELLYQPVVSMNGKVEGLEALLTWRHPIYGSISPEAVHPHRRGDRTHHRYRIVGHPAGVSGSGELAQGGSSARRGFPSTYPPCSLNGATFWKPWPPRWR